MYIITLLRNKNKGVERIKYPPYKLIGKHSGHHFKGRYSLACPYSIICYSSMGISISFISHLYSSASM